MAATGSWVGVKGAISELIFACELLVNTRSHFAFTRPGASSTGQDNRIVFGVRKVGACLYGANDTETE